MLRDQPNDQVDDASLVAAVAATATVATAATIAVAVITATAFVAASRPGPLILEQPDHLFGYQSHDGVNDSLLAVVLAAVAAAIVVTVILMPLPIPFAIVPPAFSTSMVVLSPTAAVPRAALLTGRAGQPLERSQPFKDLTPIVVTHENPLPRGLHW